MLIFIQTILKAITLGKVNERFYVFVDLLVVVVGEISSFSMFMGSWILCFASCFSMLGATFDNSEYHYLHANIALFIQTYRNSIGDIAPVEYKFWLQTIQEGYNLIPKIMICAIWGIWFLNQAMVLIILLNFLIAIIQQSYDSILERQVQNKYQNRNVINREHRLFLKHLGLQKGIDIVVLSAHCKGKNEHEKDEDWDGFVGTIKKYIYSQNIEVKTKLGNKIENVREEVLSEIKFFKKEIRTVRLEIKDKMDD